MIFFLTERVSFLIDFFVRAGFRKNSKSRVGKIKTCTYLPRSQHASAYVGIRANIVRITVVGTEKKCKNNVQPEAKFTHS